ncbi:MAG TPA: cupin domain-containing protein [Burkholderiales bacterium]|nr:cupin domain-containing protein [Burkholderiales bacterium]
MRQHKERLLGGRTPARFLREHWQKRPLLVRSAIEGFTGLLDPTGLMGLAQREDVESRLVVRRGRRWEVEHGPLSARALRRLPNANWTVLVQEVNHVVPQAAALLANFDFIPRARLDDLMVSYAPPGGGVGPHFDSYDVFLLQGMGRRLWRISASCDRTLIEGAPLKLLANFAPEQEWILEPGDMLYLPPGCAHDGVALDACMTYSIGFRAPAWGELATHFLAHLQDEVNLNGMYADPRLQPTRRSGCIPQNLIRQCNNVLAKIRWTQGDVAHFLGRYLTEPKPHVFFTAPRRRLPMSRFAREARRKQISLALRTRMLYFGNAVYINGECEPMPRSAAARLRVLADTGHLRLSDEDADELIERLYAWYRAGFLVIGECA